MQEKANPTGGTLDILKMVSPTALRREAKSPVGGYKAESFNPDPVLNAAVGFAVPYERVCGVFLRLLQHGKPVSCCAGGKQAEGTAGKVLTRSSAFLQLDSAAESRQSAGSTSPCGHIYSIF